MATVQVPACDPSTFFDSFCLETLEALVPQPWSFVVEIFLLLWAFCVLAAAADAICNALETLCDRWNVSEDVGGATFLALGNAIPETTINMITTIHSVSTNPSETGGDPKNNQTALGVGATIGSGMVAFLIVPAVCYLSADGPMKLTRRPLIRDIGFYIFMAVLLVHTTTTGVTQNTCTQFVAVYCFYLLVLLAGRPLRLKVLDAMGVERKEKVSVFRERYANAEGDDKAEGLLKNDSLSDKGSADNSSNATDEDEEATFFGRMFEFVTYPIEATCIDCRINEPKESLYPVTFAVGLAWTTLASVIVTSVIGQWVHDLGVGGDGLGFFGLVLVGMASQIPDTVNSATMAGRGYGSMALASNFGSQIVNIAIGFGLPWGLTLSAGHEVPLVWPNGLIMMGMFQVMNATLVLLMLVMTSFASPENKMTVSKPVAYTMLGLYFGCVALFAMWTFFDDSRPMLRQAFGFQSPADLVAPPAAVPVH